AGVDLRLHDAREAEPLGGRDGLLDRERDLARGDRDAVPPEQLLRLVLVDVHRPSRSFTHLTVVWRQISAIACVKGMPFGHASTQFWALPQSWMPPGRMRRSSRSSAFIRPVGCRFIKSAWPIVAAPTKPESGGSSRWNWGQTPMQQPHAMQRSSA